MLHIFSFVSNVPSTPQNGVLWSALAIIVSAIVAGSVAWIGHVISRSNTKDQVDILRKNAILSTNLSVSTKLADMRQSWIDNLREDLSEFHAIAVSPVPRDGKIVNLHRLEARIKMRLNPTDPEYPRLKIALDKMLVDNINNGNSSGAVDYVEICQAILKTEWDRLTSDLKSVS